MGKWGKKRKDGGEVGAQMGADQPARTSNRLDHVVVKEDSTRPPGRLKGLLHRVVHYRNFKLIAGVLVAALVITSGLYFFVLDNKEVISDGPKCSTETLEKAKTLFADPTKPLELQAVVSDIEKTPGYDRDASCLVVLTNYYIGISDAEKTQESWTKLNTVYDPNKGYDVGIRPAKTPEELKPTVDFLVKEAARFQKISPTGGPE